MSAVAVDHPGTRRGEYVEYFPPRALGCYSSKPVRIRAPWRSYVADQMPIEDAIGRARRQAEQVLAKAAKNRKQGRRNDGSRPKPPVSERFNRADSFS